eukprot:CAMPEP_0172379012 /NCGR_PEP_ID=MMETSP1060-20121228/69716_1 /TAXON_ID=37318 /ORGANISM="Pseudo-nitzschia pungens, Strain cf. cingulata" /LENGTH=508 /DNA_ID=CAMNT_0013106745 /DNA_START=133 /DNA_END=1659 /DNA_ORIENTATION=-
MSEPKSMKSFTTSIFMVALLLTLATAVVVATPSVTNDLEVCVTRHKFERIPGRRNLFSASITPIVRGGGIGRHGSKANNQLDDEILRLEQHLRRVHEETRALKMKLKRNAERYQRDYGRENYRAGKVNVGGRKQEEKQQRKRDANRDQELLLLANVQRLEAERDSLLGAKHHLEALKIECEHKLKLLEADLFESEFRQNDIEQSLRKKISELKDSLERSRIAFGDKANNNPELQRSIQEACQRAIVDFWNQAHKRLREHEEELRIRLQEELQDERRLTKVAVDRQKEKMRALARAMAIREQDLWQNQRQQLAKKSKGKEFKLQNSSTAILNEKQTLNDEREQEKLRLKAIREEAERKSREEEERLWLELERGLKEEREKLERKRMREEEERKRCEREELERKRILHIHAQQEQERLHQKQRQKQEKGEQEIYNSLEDSESQRSYRFDLRGIFGSNLFRSCASETSLSQQPLQEPIPASIENYRQRVPWQPLSLPPKEVVRITPSSSSD